MSREVVEFTRPVHAGAGEAQSAQSALIRLLAFQQKEAVTSLGITLKDLIDGLADYKNTLSNSTYVTPIENSQGAGAANVDLKSEFFALFSPLSVSGPWVQYP